MERHEVKKLFSYEELWAVVYLAVGYATFITMDKEFKDEKERRRMIEENVKEIIAIWWNVPDKKEYRE